MFVFGVCTKGQDSTINCTRNQLLTNNKFLHEEMLRFYLPKGKVWHACFVVRLLITGFKRPLVDDDLWALNTKNKASHMVPRIDCKYAEETRKCHRYL